MHHSGLYIPAGDGSSLPVFDGIYADIGDQQSVMGSVSTFSSHMLNVMGILERATRNSLVLLDELGTSTDPEEGSALAKAILGHLASKGVTTIATTHHRNVAAFADATPGMLNASVDLDPDTLRPTYTLTIGVPGRSYAMSIATQLGLQEKIIARARSLMDPGLVQYESWLDELQKQRTQLRVLLEEAEQGRADAEITKRDAESELADIQDRRDEILQTMRRELSAQFDDIRKQLRRAEATASWESPRGEPVDYKRATKDLEKVRSKIETFAQQTQQPAIVRQRPLRVGDAVAVMGLNLEGLIVTIDPETQEAEVAVGDVRFNLDLARLQLVETPQEKRPPEKRVDVSYSLGPLLTSNELHIRGMRAEDAMMEVEEFLDKALRDGASSVRIVHGKGTGVLRNGVRELLDHNALVKSYDFAEREHGGTGVTVVELA
jgi:DNA mismatch repair protein MutS2